MATHWVDVTSGDDANGGTSYADAVQTMDAAATLMDADADTTVQLNVVNSGDYTMDASVVPVIPDGTSSQDFIVRGSDSAGADALVSVIAPATGDSFFIAARTCNTFTVKNFEVSWHASRASTATQHFFGYGENGTQGELVLEYCRFRGTTDTSQPNGSRQPFGGGGSERNDLKTIRYCSFENMRSCLTLNGSTTYGYSIHDCVFIMDYPTERVTNGFMTGPAYGSAASELSFYNNTIFFNHLYNGSAVAFWTSLGGSGDCGTRSFYNNVYWCDTDPDGGDADIPVALFKQTSGTGTPSAGTRGGNVWYTSSEFPDSDVIDGYIAGTQWAPDSVDGKSFATDTVVNETTEGALFFDTSSSYTWSPSGTTLSWSITKDLRLVAEADSGVSGARPGALPIGATDYTVTVVADDTTPNTAQTVVITTTVSNSGFDATSVVMQASVPSGLTYVSETASQGSYVSGTGVWTVGSINDGANATLAVTCTVDTDQQGNAIDWTSSFTSGTPGASGAATDTETLNVNAQSSYTVSTKASALSPRVGETTSVTVGIVNSGVNATGVTLSCPVPTGTTYVSAAATAGSYDSVTGVWTVGALNDATAESLTLSFSIKTGQAGNTLPFTASLLTSTPQSWPDTSDDTSTKNFTIPADDPADPESPSGVPYVDVAPLYTTDLKLDLNSGMRLRKNRVDYATLRGDVEEVRWREGSFRCINVGTNLTTKLILGGIQRGQYLVMDSTTQIQISVGNDTNLYFPAKFVVLGDGDFEQVYLKNTSLTVSATVHIGVTD